MSLDYWFMFPVAIGIATVAMASGVEGATFFTPLFILGLNLPTDVAIGTGLMTEVFGFASGLFAYGYQGLIDFKLGKMLLAVTIPVALLGTVLAQWIPGGMLKIVLGLGLLVLAVSFLRSGHTSAGESPVLVPSPVSVSSFTLTSRRGQVFQYSITRPREGRILVSIGALFLAHRREAEHCTNVSVGMKDGSLRGSMPRKLTNNYLLGIDDLSLDIV